MVDVLIVGAGPAGLTAAIYARRAAKSVLLLEASACGGQILNARDVGNYPAFEHVSGPEFADRLTAQVKALGAEIRLERVLSIQSGDREKTAVTRKCRYSGRTLILAAGSEVRKLGLAREEALTGRGVSYCAACDGAFFRNKTVAVVGGGNTALEDALYLADVADTVYLIHRRSAFRGEESTLTRLKERENLHFLLDSRVTKLLGLRCLEGVEVTDRDGNVRTLAVDGLFAAVGRVPSNRVCQDLVELDAGGYIAAGEDCRTSVPGIFAAGDGRTKQVRQLVTAAADGAVAAAGAVRYLASH